MGTSDEQHRTSRGSGKQTGRKRTGRKQNGGKQNCNAANTTRRRGSGRIGATTHFLILLDRSGSMTAIARDVVNGFNAWLRDQQRLGDDAVLTLVQFDDIDDHEVLLDAEPISRVRPLTPERFTPRAATPLLDATGRIIARAQLRERERIAGGLPAEGVVVVSITDGHENASVEFTIDRIRDLVSEREAAGWTFVFLSAALDVYGEAGALGYRDHNIQAFRADRHGTEQAFISLSQGSVNVRAQHRSGAVDDALDLWGEEKPAESYRNSHRG